MLDDVGLGFLKDVLVTFVPEGEASFDRRAKWLGGVMGFKADVARSTLALLYGHGDLEAALAACRAVDEGHAEPGPYLVWTTPSMSRRCLDVLTVALGRHADQVLSPVWNYDDIGLFSPEGDAESSYRRVKAKVDAIRGRKPSKPVGLFDYAFLAKTNTGDETVLAFTPLGRGVYDAAMSLLQASDQGLMPWHDLFDRMERLRSIHPENPWVASLWTSRVLSMLGHAPWCDAGDRYAVRYVSDVPEVDACETDPIFLDAATPAVAASRLDEAFHPVELFERLYGATRTFAPPNLAGTVTPYGSDAREYPLALELATRIAMDAGAVGDATRFLRRRIDGWERHDSYLARRALAILNLNAGRPVGRLIERDDYSPEGHLIHLAQALEKKRDREVVLCLVAWLTFSTMAVRALHPRYRGCESVRIMSGEEHLGRLREALHHTRGFWTRRPDLRRRLDAVTADPAVRKAHLDYHLADERRFGWALHGPVDPGHGDALDRLEAAVREAVASA